MTRGSGSCRARRFRRSIRPRPFRSRSPCWCPPCSSSQIAARRAQSINNLKQIGLALHNFHSANSHFPADIRGKDGKPLLSWRVQILPFLEQPELFNDLQLDEPWDSPHNKALLERMPAVFAVPNSPGEPGMTFYRGFTGTGTLFDPKVPEGVGIETITDGTSNTIAVVEAKEAVPWTKPDSDISVADDPEARTNPGSSRPSWAATSPADSMPSSATARCDSSGRQSA